MAGSCTYPAESPGRIMMRRFCYLSLIINIFKCPKWEHFQKQLFFILLTRYEYKHTVKNNYMRIRSDHPDVGEVESP